MKKRRSDFKLDDSDKIKQEPLDHDKVTNPRRSKWLKWFLNIIDTIVTALT
jgi:hypothetical protein